MIEINEKGQAVAPKTIPFGEEAFEYQEKTQIRWLSSAGVMIHSHGTNIMIDPLLEGFDMPLLVDMPIDPRNVATLDAVLITHCDNDHFSKTTCQLLSPNCREYHSTQYVAELLKEESLPGYGHDINDMFTIGKMNITLTPADHAWQNEHKKYTRIYQFEDYCGFWIETLDGTIWLPGDSRLLPQQLTMPTPDAILFDFSDNSWHIGLNDAIKLANTYPDTPLLLIHWGSVDAPQMDAFNGNPNDIIKAVKNPSRVQVLAPGEPYSLKSIR